MDISHLPRRRSATLRPSSVIPELPNTVPLRCPGLIGAGRPTVVSKTGPAKMPAAAWDAEFCTLRPETATPDPGPVTRQD